MTRTSSKRNDNDVRALAGELVICGFDGLEMTPRVKTLLQTIRPTGIILFKRNVETPQQVHALLKDSQDAVPEAMFRCVDMEGGTVDRLRDCVTGAPAAESVYATGRKKMFREHGRLIGEEVAALGFNVDFAPVSDLGFAVSKQVMTTRTVSADPKETVAYVREFLKGLKDANVLGCGKHFPGLGEANLDTHKELPSIDKTWKELWKQDLVPYRELGKQFPFVMVAHAAFPKVTKDKLPASISKKWISDLLRKKVGYKGLVMADDLEMGGVQAAASIEDAALETIRAGSDLFLVCNNEALVWSTYNAVVKEGERSKAFRKLIETAAKRVRAYKKRSKEVNARFPKGPTEKTIAKLRQNMWTFTEEVRVATVGAGKDF